MEFPKRPAVQLPEQALVVMPLVFPYRPWGQGVQLTAPLPLYCPLGQASICTGPNPTEGHAYPAWQGPEHRELVSPPTPYRPASHGPEQKAVVSPSMEPYRPAGQGKHVLWPAMLYLPRPHCEAVLLVLPAGHAYPALLCNAPHNDRQQCMQKGGFNGGFDGYGGGGYMHEKGEHGHVPSLLGARDTATTHTGGRCSVLLRFFRDKHHRLHEARDVQPLALHFSPTCTRRCSSSWFRPDHPSAQGRTPPYSTRWTAQFHCRSAQGGKGCTAQQLPQSCTCPPRTGSPEACEAGGRLVPVDRRGRLLHPRGCTFQRDSHYWSRWWFLEGTRTQPEHILRWGWGGHN